MNSTWISFAFLCVLATFSASGSCQVFKVEALSFSPKAINNRGVILSEPDYINGRFRIRLFERGVLRELPLPEKSYEVFASALNDEGWVAGAYSPWQGPRRATIFKYSGAEVIDEAIRREITHVGVLPDDCAVSSEFCSQAVALNNYGQIIGSYYAGASGGWRVIVRSTSGTRDLGSLGGKWMSVTTINNLGHILGSGDTPDGETHFFLIDGNGLRDLGSLGRVSIYPIDITDKDSIQIAPVAMNDRDEIAGYINEYGDPPTEDSNHVFLYKNGTFMDLGCPENGRCMVSGMNSNGHIIGSVSVDLGDGDYEHHDFLYADGRFQYLDALLSNGKGWSELRLIGINDADQIVGIGSFEGMGTGFVMQPVP